MTITKIHTLRSCIWVWDFSLSTFTIHRSRLSANYVLVFFSLFFSLLWYVWIYVFYFLKKARKMALYGIAHLFIFSSVESVLFKIHWLYLPLCVCVCLFIIKTILSPCFSLKKKFTSKYFPIRTANSVRPAWQTWIYDDF